MLQDTPKGLGRRWDQGFFLWCEMWMGKNLGFGLEKWWGKKVGGTSPFKVYLRSGTAVLCEENKEREKRTHLKGIRNVCCSSNANLSEKQSNRF